MDSWTPQQIALMKAGGNDKCKANLTAKGIPPNASIKEKYESDAALHYKEVVKARAEGRMEPTESPRKLVRNGGGDRGEPTVRSSEDPNGMERLTGETNDQYVVRQKRKQEEARARMVAKFGGSNPISGVRNGGGKMQGIGSNSSNVPSCGDYSNQSGIDLEDLTDSISAGLGSAWSAVGSITAKAGSAFSNERKVMELTNRVKSTGMGLWSSVISVAQEATKTLTEPDGGNGLSELQKRLKVERDRSGTSRNIYECIGSDIFVEGTNNIGGRIGNVSNTGLATAMVADPNGIKPLMEESEDYVKQQRNIMNNANARMEAKVGNTRTMTSLSALPSSVIQQQSFLRPFAVDVPSKSSPGDAKVKKIYSNDFFSSFGT